MGEVAKLKAGDGVESQQHDETVTPGVDVGYAFSIDEKRSLSMRTMFPQNTGAAEQEQILSQVMSVTAVVALKEKLVEFRKDRANAQERLKVLDEHPKRLAEIQVEIDELQKQAVQQADAAERSFKASGRVGQFKPVGKDKATLDGLQRDIDKRKAEKGTLMADIGRQRDELTKAIGNWDVAISNAEREITIRREAYGA